MEARGFGSYHDLWRWSVEDLGGFWGSIWDEHGVGARTGPRAGTRHHAGRGLVPGGAAELRRVPARHGEARGDRDRERLGVGAARLDDLGRAARPGGVLRGRPEASRRGARRPRGRLHAERARDRRGLARLREHRRDLVELRAGVRHAHGGRPLQADRAEGADRHRGLPLRRARLRPPSARAGDRGGDPVARAHGAGALRVGGPARRAGGAHVRAGAVRPPALGALLVGHDGAAEGDRPGPGRDPARAPEEGQPAQRPRAGGPLLLVHHHRLDDVELPGRRPAVGLGDRALRRPARPARAVGPRRGGGRHRASARAPGSSARA